MSHIDVPEMREILPPDKMSFDIVPVHLFDLEAAWQSDVSF